MGFQQKIAGKVTTAPKISGAVKKASSQIKANVSRMVTSLERTPNADSFTSTLNVGLKQKNIEPKPPLFLGLKADITGNYKNFIRFNHSEQQEINALNKNQFVIFKKLAKYKTPDGNFKFKSADLIELSRLGDVLLQKAKMVKDKNIKAAIFKEILSISKEPDLKKLKTHLEASESLANAYNVSEGHYSLLDTPSHSYYKYLNTGSPEKAQSFAKHARIETVRELDPNAEEFIKEREEFRNDVRLEGLKEYVFNYSKIHPEMTKYMYEKYYLSKLHFYIQQICKEISDKFGTKLFIGSEKEADINNLRFINKELNELKKAGGEKAIIPAGIDLSKIKHEYVGHNWAAYFNPDETSIHLRGNSRVPASLRHELTHCNDTKLGENGIINGVDSDAIMSSRQYEDELIKAGLPEDEINAAYKNKSEFIAHASEGDYSKYSDGFKETLIKLGLPKWIFSMKPNCQMN